MMVSPEGCDTRGATHRVQRFRPPIYESAQAGIAQSAEGATQPSPDREVGVGEEYDGEPRRARHNREKGLNTIV